MAILIVEVTEAFLQCKHCGMNFDDEDTALRRSEHDFGCIANENRNTFEIEVWEMPEFRARLVLTDPGGA